MHVLLVSCLLLSLADGLRADGNLERLQTRLQVLEDEQSAFTPALVEPLLELAGLHQAAGDYDQGLELLHRAQHILHRQHGVHAIEQVPVIDRMIELSVRSMDLETASAMNQLRFDVVENHHGPAHHQSIAAGLKLGRWYESLGYLQKARTLYRHAASHLVPDVAPRLMWEVQTALAFNQYLNGRCCELDALELAFQGLLADERTDTAEKESAAERLAAIKVMSGRRSIDFDIPAWAERAPSLLGISRADRVARAYLLQGTTPAQGRQDDNPFPPGELMGTPIPFCAARVSDLVRDRPLSDIKVELHFVVNSRGRAEEIRITSSNAPPRLNNLVKQVVGLSRFHPALADGKPVSQAVTMVQEFAHDQPLFSDNLAFPPANLAVFHACHLVARTIDRDADWTRQPTVKY